MDRSALINDLHAMLSELPCTVSINGGTAIAASLASAAYDTLALTYGEVKDYKRTVIISRSDLTALPDKNTPVILTIGLTTETLYVVGCREYDLVTAQIDLRS